LESRQNEIAEMQRLTEERLLRQWEEWQASFARDWQKRTVAEEDRWRRQDISNQKDVERLAALDEQATLNFREIVALWESVLARIDSWSEAVQDVARASQATPDEHLKELRRLAEEKHTQLI
jgi:hypothetical protein